MTNALYEGQVGHVRLRPRLHRLRYRIFYLLLDIDAPPRLRWFSVARRNLVSWYPTDHGTGGTASLRAQIGALLAPLGLVADGRIDVLTMPRVFGFAFNPLNVFFCRNADGALVALVHEVNNTFGERHHYALPVSDTAATVIEQSCAKAFHVSPFMDMALTYRFRVQQPDARIGVAIAVDDDQGPLLNAHFNGKHKVLTDRVILGCVLRYPVLALKVIAGIHGEAFLLWIKGMKLRKHPLRQPVERGG